MDGYKWKDQDVRLAALVRGCKIKNDTLITRLPIGKKLLTLLNFELEKKSIKNNWSAMLIYLYRTSFMLMYYGLMRIGEITKSEHVVKAKDVFLSENTEKVSLILYTSKTHDRSSRPQIIKIFADNERQDQQNFNPVETIKGYLSNRPAYKSNKEQFLVFNNNAPLLDTHVRVLLKELLRTLNLDADLYNTHSFRIGQATDLRKNKVPVDNIKNKGRWKSSAVYNYLRN